MRCIDPREPPRAPPSQGGDEAGRASRDILPLRRGGQGGKDPGPSSRPNHVGQTNPSALQRPMPAASPHGMNAFHGPPHPDTVAGIRGSGRRIGDPTMVDDSRSRSTRRPAWPRGRADAVREAGRRHVDHPDDAAPAGPRRPPGVGGVRPPLPADDPRLVPATGLEARRRRGRRPGGPAQAPRRDEDVPVRSRPQLPGLAQDRHPQRLARLRQVAPSRIDGGSGPIPGHPRLARALDDLGSWMEDAFERELLDLAMRRVERRVKPANWRAFRLTAIDQRPAPRPRRSWG